MPRGANLINVARGALLDEEALLAALGEIVLRGISDTVVTMPLDLAFEVGNRLFEIEISCHAPLGNTGRAPCQHEKDQYESTG